MANKVSQSDMNKNKLNAELVKKITEHNRDFLTGKIKLPLTDTALKNVHTNQFLFMNLPEEMPLTNWEVLANALNNNTNRFVEYKRNRLYIDGVDIKVTANGTAEMELSLNAFPSSLSSYADAYKQYEKKVNGNSSNGKNNNKTNAVAGNNTTIKNGWWGEWVTDLVKKNVGNETDTLKKCKKMYEVFCNHTIYRLYYDAQYTASGVSSLKSVWEKGTWLNCGDGANFLSAFMECCGAKSEILLGYGCNYGHYVVKVTINGSTYWCDHASNTGSRTTRGWNATFCGIRSGSSCGRYIDYS